MTDDKMRERLAREMESAYESAKVGDGPTVWDAMAAKMTADGIVLVPKDQTAAAERERLRNVWDGWQEYGMPPDVQRAMDSGDTPHVVWRLLTEDTP
jgi:hypothetical protein